MAMADRDSMEKRKRLGEPYQLSSHSSAHDASFEESSGGTLAVALSSSDTFAVSGGGDGVCCFYRLDPDRISEVGCDAETVELVARMSPHTSGVSALAAEGEYAVSGGKDGVSFICGFLDFLHFTVI